MRSTSTPRWQFGLCLSIVISALCVASGGAPLSAELDVDQDPAEPGMLIMKSGDVVTGRILRNGRDYLVKVQSGGEVFVPATMVRLRSKNIHDAYRQLRVAFPENHGAESHMALARFCLTHKLYSDARQELKDALLMEPDRAEAQNMLERLNTMIDPTTAEQKQDAPAIVEVSRSRSRAEEVESLGGLPRDVAAQFTARIQPLLSRKCATAGCHGYQEEEREFRMQKLVNGPNRHSAERNLANILKFIDLEHPKDSPLLLKPRGNHGRGGRTIFSGSAGNEQYNDLKDWVLNVAANREEPSTPTVRKVTSRRGGGKIRTAAHFKPARVREDKPANADTSETDHPALSPSRRIEKKPIDEREPSASAPSDQELKPAAPAGKDPFDPAEFNEQSGK